MIMYCWNFKENKVCCTSHFCITSDLNKSNEQVTHFIESVFKIYSDYYRDGEPGRTRYLSLWSGNCGDKNKFRFGWGSSFLRKYHLNGIFFNYFAPGMVKVYATAREE